jgi:hypothetical protein
MVDFSEQIDMKTRKRKELVNKHLCEKKNTTKKKENVGYEVITSTDVPFQLNKETAPRFMRQFQKKHDHWFKFVIFQHESVNYIYVVKGNKVNKHSVCVLKGFLDLHKGDPMYDAANRVYKDLIRMNGTIGSKKTLRKKLNKFVENEMPCMPVLSAGSGTVNEDGTICLNTKSGHYKPTKRDIEFAKDIFEDLLHVDIQIQLKTDKDLLKEKYGDKYKNYTGICL